MNSELVASGRPVRPTTMIRNTLVAAGGQAAGYFLFFLAMPLLTRLFTPEQFGVFAVYQGFVAVLGVTVTLRYEVAIPITRSERLASNLFAVSLCLSLINAITLASLCWMLSELTPLSSPLFFLALALHALGLGIVEACSAWIVRHKQFPCLSLMRFVQNLGCVVASIGLGLVAASAESLAIGLLCGCWCAALAGLLGCRVVQAMRGELSLRRLMYVLKRYRKFPLIEAPSYLAYAVALALPSLLFERLYSAEVAGWYGLGIRVLSMPLMLLGIAAAKVYASEAAECVRSGEFALQKLFRKTLARLSFVAVPTVSVAALLCPMLFPYIFGPQWREAGVYCMLLAPWTVTNLLSTVVFSSVNIVEKQHWTLLGNVTFACFLITGLIAPSILGWPPRTAVLCLSAGGMFGATSMIVIAWIAIGQRSEPGRRLQ